MQKLVRVNSKYRDSGTTSNFFIKFEVRDLDGVKAISVARASLSRSFPNIYAPINELTWVPNTQDPVTITIPPAQYTATSLAAAITTSSGGDWTVTYSAAPIDRFSFTYNNGTWGSAELKASSTIGPYIGLTADTLVPGLAFPVLMPSGPQLEGPTQVYIQSSRIAGSNCVETSQNGSYIPFISAINFSNVPYGFSAYFEAKTPQIFQLNYTRESGVRQLNYFDIQITDTYGNILPVGDNNFLDMHLVFYF